MLNTCTPPPAPGLESAAPQGFIMCLPPGGKKGKQGKKGVAPPGAPSPPAAPGPADAMGAVAEEPVVYDEFHPIAMRQVRRAG